MTAPTLTSLSLFAPGRPAPQGSKHQGEHGQMREASPYLPPWRRAVVRAVYTRYAELGIEPDALPLFRGPVGVSLHFVLPTGRRIDGPPDLDKLARAVFDALTKARVWEDDGRVTAWGPSGKRHIDEFDSSTGCHISVWQLYP